MVLANEHKPVFILVKSIFFLIFLKKKKANKKERSEHGLCIYKKTRSLASVLLIQHSGAMHLSDFANLSRKYYNLICVNKRPTE